jgi:hypothetical protein
MVSYCRPGPEITCGARQLHAAGAGLQFQWRREHRRQRIRRQHIGARIALVDVLRRDQRVLAGRAL